MSDDTTNSQEEKIKQLEQKVKELSQINHELEIDLEKQNKNLAIFKIIEEYSTDVIGWYDKDFTPLYISPSCIKYAGYSSEELMKKSAFDLIHPEDLDKFQQEVMTSLEKKLKSFTTVYRIKHAAGHYMWNESKSHPKYVNDMLQYIVVNSRDISDRKKAEQEIVEAKKKAEESDKLKSAFLANMSHEIRTPMNGIIGFSEMLIDSEIDGDKKENFARIVIESGKQLLSIVDDILDISQIETGIVQIIKEKFNLNNLLLELFAFFKSQMQTKTVHLFVAKDLSDFNSTIETDKIRLRQILSNLVNNALKFTQEGHIKFGYLVQHNSLLFYVEDTGIGIEKENQITIFERFRQEEINTSRKYGGTGLGLSISNKLVELLGGEMWLESEKGKGTTFYFTIPYDSIEEKELVLREKAKSVLIVDDEEINIIMLEEVLNTLKIPFYTAKHGREAVDVCKENSNIALILMDLKMPVMDGFDALEEIRKFNKSVPVIAQTAYAMIEDKKRCLEAGFNNYVAKPIKRESLIAMIETYIKR